MRSTSIARGGSCEETAPSSGIETSSIRSQPRSAQGIDCCEKSLEPSLVVGAVDAPPTGILAVRFLNETSLNVLPDRRETYDEDVEHWRFFAPGSDAPHLVYRSTEFELE